MKNLLALICGLIFFISCSNNNAPDNLIKKKDMVNVLIDMHLADASLDYLRNDSVVIYAKSKYNYLFEKYKIDSTAFTNSLNYYSNNSTEFAEIYKEVVDNLSKINKPEIIKIERFKRTIPDSLRFGIARINKLKRDSIAKEKSKDSLQTSKSDSLSNRIARKKIIIYKKDKVVSKDSVKLKNVKVLELDKRLKKADSLNTVKLLGIGIDF